jgi:hypothetical protein
MTAGWASLIATILFIGGAQMLCIGMIGEYLGRAYLKLNGKPQFIVRALTWKKTKISSKHLANDVESPENRSNCTK